MKLSTLCLAIPAAYLLGVTGIKLLEVQGSKRGTALETSLPSVAQATGGAEETPPFTEPSTTPLALSEMHATTPAEVRVVLRITSEATVADRSALSEAALMAEDPLVAGNAALALGRLKHFSSDEDLLALVIDPRLRVRQDAVKACGLDGREAALSCLERVLAENDASLRPLVLEALGKIGGDRARALVQEVAEDSFASKTDRVFARAALEEMQI